MRWLFPHHVKKRPGSSLNMFTRFSCSPLTQPTQGESSEYFWRWQGSDLYSKSKVHNVKKNSESTVSCAAVVLLTTCSDTQPFSFMNVCQVVKNLGDCGDIYLYFLECLTQQGRMNHGTGKIRENYPHIATCFNKSGLLWLGYMIAPRAVLHLKLNL